MLRARALSLALMMAVALAFPASAQQDTPHRAGLVVVHGDGRVVTACVAFEEESISGLDLLQRSGLALTLGAYGGLGYGVCAIDGEGCGEGERCFCQCESSPCRYWVYSHRQADGSWMLSGVGASGWRLRDGDVDGWVWGDGSTAPPQVDFAEVCVEEAPATPSPALAATQPPATPAASPPATQVATATSVSATESARSQPAFPVSYLAFAALALGLLGVLLWGTRRRR